jgi:deoxyribose-phosphate aldolase
VHVLTATGAHLAMKSKRFMKACGPAHMKSIIATGEPGTLKKYHACSSIVCMQAGLILLRPSYRKEPTNATLVVV